MTRIFRTGSRELLNLQPPGRFRSQMDITMSALARQDRLFIDLLGWFDGAYLLRDTEFAGAAPASIVRPRAGAE
jgi:hypothetical protein